jgi:hypothetical protein
MVILTSTNIVPSGYYSACHVLYTFALSELLKYSGSKEIAYEWLSTRLEVGLKVCLVGIQLDNQMITC